MNAADNSSGTTSVPLSETPLHETARVPSPRAPSGTYSAAWADSPTITLPGAGYNYSGFSVLAGPADPAPEGDEPYRVRMRPLARRRPIRTLLITLFAKYMRPVIEQGRLYAAMPPLHKVVTKGRNSETLYTYTQQEMESTVTRIERDGRQVQKPVPRFKGHGELDADELWDTTLNPAARTVRRITIEDAERAEATLELLMGERVEPRKNWLIEAAGRIDQETIDA